MVTWHVWITGYPDSYSTVKAIDHLDAMRLGAKEQKASHHGEVVEINARPAYNSKFQRNTITRTKFARINREGEITFS